MTAERPFDITKHPLEHYWSDRKDQPEGALDAPWSDENGDEIERGEPDPPKHEPGDHHRYRLECTVCGQLGEVRLSIEPQRSEP